MIAMDYSDMMSKTITTAIATGPMFFTISDIVKVSAAVAPGLAAAVASCNKKNSPSALIPRRLVRIVTVNPSKVLLD
jgi:hypothetical protein